MPVPEIQAFREKYPQYNDMSDQDLSASLAAKYPQAYRDLPSRVAGDAGRLEALQKAGKPGQLVLASENVQGLVESRPSLRKSLMSQLNAPGKLNRMMTFDPQGPMTALTALGAAGQSVENLESRPFVNAIRRIKGQPALKGGYSEFGDVGRELGYPEWTNKVGGMITAGILDPIQIGKAATAFAGKIYQQGIKKTMQGAKSYAMQAFLGMNPEKASHLIKTNFRAATEVNLRPNMAAAQELGNDLIKKSDDLVYKPAKEAWENLKVTAPDTVVPSDLNIKLQDDVLEAIGGDFDRIRADKAYAPIVAMADKASKGQAITLSDWLAVKSALVKQSRFSKPAMHAVDVIGKDLKGVFPELADASAKWSDWITLSNARDVLTEEAVQHMPGQGKVAKKIVNLASYFDEPPSGHVRSAAQAAADIMDKYSPGYGKKLLDSIADVSATTNTGSIKTRLTAMTMAGGLGTWASMANPALAPLMPYMAASIAAESTPKVSMALGKASSKVAQGAEDVVSKVMSNQIRGDLIRRTAGYGLARPIVGRNDQQ